MTQKKLIFKKILVLLTLINCICDNYICFLFLVKKILHMALEY